MINRTGTTALGAKKLNTLPPEPGVYLFYDKKKRLLYIGKAVHLRSRVRSYFSPNRETFNAARAKMIAEIADVKWERAASEPEALIREAELIKKLKPRYNVL